MLHWVKSKTSKTLCGISVNREDILRSKTAQKKCTECTQGRTITTQYDLGLSVPESGDEDKESLAHSYRMRVKFNYQTVEQCLPNGMIMYHVFGGKTSFNIVLAGAEPNERFSILASYYYLKPGPRTPGISDLWSWLSRLIRPDLEEEGD